MPVFCITGTLYYWEQDPNINSHNIRDYDGGYRTYTITAGGVETITPSTFYTYDGEGSINGASGTGNTGKTPRRYIPIGQGFMVEGMTNGTVNAENAHREYIKESAANSEFFKSSNKKTKSPETNQGFSIVPNDYKRFRLNIDFDNTYTRQLVETFHETATEDFDRGLESKINDADVLPSDAFWPIGNSAYVAEALAFNENLKVPLTIKVNQNMPVRIRITDVQNFDDSQAIYIHDIENDLYINLKKQDFEMNLKTGNYTNRFEVTFNNQSLNVNDINFDDFDIFQNNTLSELQILNPNNIEVKLINLYDNAGKRVLNQNISETQSTYTFSTKFLSDGVYIAKASLFNNQDFTKKIIITNKN